jgi:FkbM family methyltransferase
MNRFEDKLWVPVGDPTTAPANINEWDQKGKRITDLCHGHNVVVQAGGNLGWFPIQLSAIFNTVISFEPVHTTYECMVRNVHDYLGDKHNIIMENAGLSETPGNGTANVVLDHNCGATTVTDDADGELRLTTIDEVYSMSNFSACDLIWLDIEGMEKNALMGAKETINTYNPVVVVENKGLIPGFGGGLHGSIAFDNWIAEEFNYKKLTRMMRDDIYVPAG